MAQTVHSHSDHAGHDDHAGHADQWHTHDASEPAPQAGHGKINFGMLIGVFLGIVAFVTVSVVALAVAFNHTNMLKQETITERSLAAEYRPQRERVERDLMEAQFKVLDAQKKTVQIPLSAAMDKVLAKYGEGTKPLPQPKGTLAPGTLYSPE
jgi:hypothetical protein